MATTSIPKSTAREYFESIVVAGAVVGMYRPMLLFNPMFWATSIYGAITYSAIGTVAVIPFGAWLVALMATRRTPTRRRPTGTACKERALSSTPWPGSRVNARSGAMRACGPQVWGWPKDRDTALAGGGFFRCGCLRGAGHAAGDRRHQNGGTKNRMLSRSRPKGSGSRSIRMMMRRPISG